MRPGGAFGQQMARHFRLSAPPVFTTASLRKAPFAVTRLRFDQANHGMIEGIPAEPAFVFVYQLRDVTLHELWLSGRSVRVEPYLASSFSAVDLALKPSAYVADPFDTLHFYLSRAALDELSEEEGSPRIEGLHCAPGTSHKDPVVTHFASVLALALEQPERASKLFLDHTCLALQTHLARSFGELRQSTSGLRGGLSPSLERRAKELLSSSLDGELSLAQLAAECGLSRSHFARAFRRTTGQPPHRWLQQQRVERAQDLLLRTPFTIAEVARSCGFADQSHLTKAFTKSVGTSPAAWRRAQRD